MTQIVKLSLVASITLAATVHAEESRDRLPSVREAVQSVTKQTPKDVGVVDSLKHMFQDGKVSGNIRSMYSGYNNDNDVDTYATALGGQLKYELAKYKGFNGAVAFTTSHDIDFASGDTNEGERNDELSSDKGSYTELTEAYINYEFNGLNLRAGRQIVDTPLADSDDIRMVPNTFEAYIASYETNGFSLMAGYLNQWQGADAGLDSNDPWVKTGKDGVIFGGLTYGNDFVEANAWYYNISNASTNDIANGADENGNKAIYVDIIGNYIVNDDLELHAGVQYLKESELDNSNVEANIYGAMAEVVVYGLGLNIAYNKSTKETGKHSFSGYGGGTLFTNMDTMIIDEITEDRDVQSVVAGLSYSIDDFNLLYAYGDFDGDANSLGEKAHITEQDIGVEYTPNDDLTLAAIYVINDNKEDGSSADFNSKNFRILASYNF
jgi:hypothetical protein